MQALKPALADAADFCNSTDCKSIGTLTSWQILAEQLGNQDTFNEEDALAVPLKGHNGAKSMSGNVLAASVGIHLDLRSPSFVSPQPTLSGIFGLTEAPASFVTPKQLHVLYKEYRLLNEIGSGAFGRVCKAKRLRDGKEVVVKEIRTANLSGKMKAATMDEVQVLAKMNHPNIVKYHDCFMDEIYIDIVMEYCSAGDVGKLIKAHTAAKQPFTEDEVMFLFVQICLALQYTHAAGVLHRDLKASNCMLLTPSALGVQGNASMQGYATGIGSPLVKLGDFGVAKITGGEAGSICNTVVGTPQYLPPEMLESKPYGRRSDVWALGCILYELCTLKRAFESDKIPVIYYKITQGTFEPLPESCSQNLRDLVQQMLSKDPQGRPTVLELLQQPYVRSHLCLYLEWARGVPEAHPEVLLKSMGETWSKGVLQHMALKPASSAVAAPPAGGSPQRKLPGPLGHSRLSSSSGADSPTSPQLDRMSSVVTSSVMPHYNLQQYLNSTGAIAAQVSPTAASHSKNDAAASSEHVTSNSGWIASPRSHMGTSLNNSTSGAATISASVAAKVVSSSVGCPAEANSSTQVKSVSSRQPSSPATAPIAGVQPGGQPACGAAAASSNHGITLTTSNSAFASPGALAPDECSSQPAMPARHQLSSPSAAAELVGSAQQCQCGGNSELASSIPGQSAVPGRHSNSSLARLHVTAGCSSTRSRRSSWLIDASILSQRLKGSSGFCDMDDCIRSAAAAAGMTHSPTASPRGACASAFQGLHMADAADAVDSADEAAFSVCGAKNSSSQRQQLLLQAEETMILATRVFKRTTSLVIHADESSSTGRAPGTPLAADMAHETPSSTHLRHVPHSTGQLQRRSRSLNDLIHSSGNKTQGSINGRFHNLNKWLEDDLTAWSPVEHQLAQLVSGNSSSMLCNSNNSSSSIAEDARYLGRVEIAGSINSSCDAHLVVAETQSVQHSHSTKHGSNKAAPDFWLHSGLFQLSGSCQQQQQQQLSEQAPDSRAMHQLQHCSVGPAVCDPNSPAAVTVCQVHRALPAHAPVGPRHKATLISTHQQRQVEGATNQLQIEGREDAAAFQLPDTVTGCVFITDGSENQPVRRAKSLHTAEQPTEEHRSPDEQSLGAQYPHTCAPCASSASLVLNVAQWVAQVPAGLQHAGSGGSHGPDQLEETRDSYAGEDGTSTGSPTTAEAALADDMNSSRQDAGAVPSMRHSRRAALVAEQQEVLNRMKAFKSKLLSSVPSTTDAAAVTPAAGMQSPRVSSPSGTVSGEVLSMGSLTSSMSRSALLAGGSATSMVNSYWGPQCI